MLRLFSGITIVTFILFLFVTSAMAQQIPDPVLNAFTQKFQNTEQAKWEIENDDENGKKYEVNFKLNGEQMSAEFTKDGIWRETEIAIKKNDLPDGVKQSLRENFSEAEVEHAFKVTTPEQALYEVIVEIEEEFEDDYDETEMDQEENEDDDNEDYEEEEDEFLYEVIFTADGKIIEKKEIGDDED